MNGITGYKYFLDKSSKKFIRPSCGSKRLVKYKDSSTGEYLPDLVGRCDREDRCGYHLPPRQYFTEAGITPGHESYIIAKPNPVQPVDYLPLEYVEQSCRLYYRSTLFSYFKSLFSEPVATDLLKKYLVGNTRYWQGGTVFWQMDNQENIRQCKIMLYDPWTGKRIKAGTKVQLYDMGSKKYIETITEDDCSKVFGRYINNETRNLNLQQCFFGEHLLSKYPDKTVAIVESEKTAMIASVYMPGYLWMATGGITGCKWSEYSVIKVLQGRNVILFPDASLKKKDSDKTAFEKWHERAVHISETVKCNIRVSDLLEKLGTQEQKKEGWDLADFLITRDEVFGWALKDPGYPAIWDYKIAS